MAGIFTRRAIAAILNDAGLSTEARTDQLFSLYGRALEDGYVAKAAAQALRDAAVDRALSQAKLEAEAEREAAIQAAVSEARAGFERDNPPPDPTRSDAYKALRGEYDAYRARQGARVSADYRDVKPKFFDAVYDLVDRAEGAKPLEEQLADIRGQFEEYFLEAPAEPGRPTPAVVLPTGAPPAPAARLTLTEAMQRANAGERVDVGRILN